jgi:hypothetical protein
MHIAAVRRCDSVDQRHLPLESEEAPGVACVETQSPERVNYPARELAMRQTRIAPCCLQACRGHGPTPPGTWPTTGAGRWERVMATGSPQERPTRTGQVSDPPVASYARAFGVGRPLPSGGSPWRGPEGNTSLARYCTNGYILYTVPMMYYCLGCTDDTGRGGDQ